MLDHKFRVGQIVDRNKGHYTIVRLLPMDSDTPQYRVQNNTDGQERMVHESELATRN